MRVVEQRDRLGLVLEPSQLVVRGQCGRPDHLERDRPVEADLAGLVDDPHAAAADLADQLVVAEVANVRTGCWLPIAVAIPARCDRPCGRRVGPWPSCAGRCGSVRLRPEDGVDHVGAIRESAAILLPIGSDTRPREQLTLDPQKLLQQQPSAAIRPPRPGNPRSAAGCHSSIPVRTGSRPCRSRSSPRSGFRSWQTPG